MSLLYWACGIIIAVVVITSALAWKRTATLEAAYPPIGQFLDVNGTRVHYTKTGSGPAVVLIHGAGGNLRDWDFSLAAKLARTNTVISFDRPGHGYTDTLHNNGETLYEQAQLLHTAIKQLNLETVTVVGYSFGGAVALRIALDFPKTVQGIVLVSAVTNEWPGDADGLYRHIANPVYGWMTANILGGLVPLDRIKSGYASIFIPQSTPEGFLEHTGPAMTTRPHSFRANSRQIVGLKAQIIEQSKRYADLSIPIEVIHGTKDSSVYFEIHTPQFNAAVPHARLTRLDGMGHGAHILAEDEILAAVKRVSK